ncbi:MAG: NADH-quinone oxidoreductase subunit G [Proteobacteria bacterium]|nr:MAG: NADH-quinone oxidoreductase subunit G [Pseudomonadota bacterium]
MSDKAELVTLEIDGQMLEARPGSMLIEVADAAGIAIPRFCYHKKLSVAANCRMCLVEVEKSFKPLPACATPVTAGMKVWTRSAKTRESQRSVMEFLLVNHPLDCPICDQGGECELQDIAMAYGSGESSYHEIKRVVLDKDIGALIATCMTRCIQCTRCVRFGDEIAGLRELGATGRGENTSIGTYVEKALVSELSGNVIDLCPVGALTAKPSRYKARAWEMLAYPSISAHDAVGSNLEVHTFDGEVVRCVPRENEAVNECWISDRDRFAYAGLYAEDRLTKPQIKRDGEWQEISWQEALDKVADILKYARPDQMGALAAPQATLEEFYLLQKLIRGLGCNNIDYRLRQMDFRLDTHEPALPVLGVSIAELEQQEAVLLVGAWPRHEQPLLNHRLRKAVSQGARIMAINPWQAEFNYTLDQLVIPPAQMVTELAMIARAACERAGKAIPAHVSDLCSQQASEQSQQVVEALLAVEHALVLTGAVAMQHPDSASLQALAEVIAAHTGAKLGQLAAANAMGASLAGALPHRGVGGVLLEQTEDQPGLAVSDMLSANVRHFLLLQAEAEDFASPRQAINAFEQAEDVVLITPFASDLTRQFATLLLPCSTFMETSGTFVNAEGRWQSFQGVAKPLGEARPAWKILRVLGNLLKQPAFDYLSTEEIAAELRLETQLLKVDTLDSDIANVKPPRLVPPEQYDLGMQRIGDVHIYRSDALVRRSAPLQEMTGALVAYIHPQDQLKLELQAGDLLAFEQEGTRIQLPFACDEAIPLGCVRLQAGFEAGNTLGTAFGFLTVSRA